LGIPFGTWRQWVLFGRRELQEFSEGQREPKDLTLYAELILALEKAEGKCAIGILDDVTKARTEDGRPDVRAREWFLERRHNKLFSRNPNAIVDGEAGEAEEQPRGREILLGKLLLALGRTVIEGEPGGGDDA